MPNPNPKTKHLKPFQKGNKAGVGHGRPKGKSLKTILQEAMDDNISLKNKQTGKLEKKTTAEWLVAVGIKSALNGDFRYFKEIFDRLEGRPLQTINALETVDLDLSTLTDEQLDRQIDRLSK